MVFRPRYKKMCPSCYKHNGVFVFPQKGFPQNCAFCSHALYTVEKVLGDDFKQIISKMLEDTK